MMCLRFARLLAMCVIIAGAFGASPGCAGPDTKETVDSMSNFGLEVAKVKDSIDNAIKTLENVVASQPADINANVTAYSNNVAALTRKLLDEGRRFCFLYTDLANPTSNKIYYALGYRPVCENLRIDFTPRAT